MGRGALVQPLATVRRDRNDLGQTVQVERHHGRGGVRALFLALISARPRRKRIRERGWIWGVMIESNKRALTIPEAAYVTGTSERAVNHEIDAKIMGAGRAREGRAVSHADLVYLGAVRDIRDQISPKLRREIRDAVRSAVSSSEVVATIASLKVPVAAIEEEILANVEKLQKAREHYIESRSEVLAGDPVIRGTRIAARLVGDLLKQGTSPMVIAEEYDLTMDQIEAASIFSRVTPKRGRPRVRRIAVTEHVPAH